MAMVVTVSMFPAFLLGHLVTLLKFLLPTSTAVLIVSLTQSRLEIYIRNLLTSISIRVLVPEVVVAFFELLRRQEQRESYSKQLR